MNTQDELHEKITQALAQMSDVEHALVTIERSNDGYIKLATVEFAGTAEAGEIFNRLNHDAQGQSLRPAGCELLIIPRVAAMFIYPLYCVDRGKHGTDDCQYYGPFDSHAQAVDALPPNDAEPEAHIRRCRRVKPSEIYFNFDEIEVELGVSTTYFNAAMVEDKLSADLRDPFDWLVDELDEAATTGELPNAAWHRVGGRIVEGAKVTCSDPADFPLPTAANFHAWIDEYLSVDAWICEGDE